jgi:Ca2+-binding RTX toxin-like protein
MSIISGAITNGSDVIICDEADDLLTNLLWNDSVEGGGGNDTLQGAVGSFTLDGGDGDDSVGVSSTNIGSNVLRGGNGNDTLRGGQGNNLLEGGEGDDSLFSGVFFPGLNTTLMGGGGNDTLEGNGIFYGEDGNDVLSGNGGFSGGDGDDTLTSSQTSYLFGGNGNDVIGGKGTLDGGEGEDTITGGGDLSGGSGDDVITGELLTQVGLGQSPRPILPTASRVDGGDGNDTLIGGNFTSFNSSISLAGFVSGGNGDDFIKINAPINSASYAQICSVDGGNDTDTMVVAISDFAVRSSYGSDGVGVITSDRILRSSIQYSNIERLNLTTGGFDDVLVGTAGNDTLKAAAGDDTLEGGEGNDLLLGGEGNDFLQGGAGSDQLKGGAGRDTFAFGGAGLSFGSIARDRLINFNSAEDTIALSQATFNDLGSPGGLAPEQFAVVSSYSEAARSDALVVYNSSSGALFYNQNGRAGGLGTGGVFAQLTGLPDLSVSNFSVVA